MISNATKRLVSALAPDHKALRLLTFAPERLHLFLRDHAERGHRALVLVDLLVVIDGHNLVADVLKLFLVWRFVSEAFLLCLAGEGQQLF